jgi:signal recognition particle receptor subunit beta
MDESKLKIVVFGAFGAGKSTLIKTLDHESKHIEANCAGGTTTVALDFGRILNNGCHIHIYGTPGQERFEFAREIIAKGMDGAILYGAKVPFVVFLNKCDGIGANPEAFGGLFGESEVHKISANDKRQCMDALLKFTGTLPAHQNGHIHK